jgi:hypothetical protein
MASRAHSGEDASPRLHSLAESAARVQAVADKPTRMAFLARALHALARLTPALDEASLAHAAGAPSDYAVLLYALEDPAALSALRRDDPLAAARLRGLEVRLQILEQEGGTLSAAEVARELGLSRQAVDKRRRVRRLLALPAGRRYAYPAWQLTDGGVLDGFEPALRALNIDDPWSQAAFFLGPNIYLDGATPLAQLRRGRLASVLRAAHAYGEHGAP